jgi:hypothetical protein
MVLASSSPSGKEGKDLQFIFYVRPLLIEMCLGFLRFFAIMRFLHIRRKHNTVFFFKDNQKIIFLNYIFILGQHLIPVPRRLFFATQQRIAITWKPKKHQKIRSFKRRKYQQ